MILDDSNEQDLGRVWRCPRTEYVTSHRSDLHSKIENSIPLQLFRMMAGWCGYSTVGVHYRPGFIALELCRRQGAGIRGSFPHYFTFFKTILIASTAVDDIPYDKSTSANVNRVHGCVHTVCHRPLGHPHIHADGLSKVQGRFSGGARYLPSLRPGLPYDLPTLH